jgi:hypothetical protein
MLAISKKHCDPDVQEGKGKQFEALKLPRWFFVCLGKRWRREVQEGKGKQWTELGIWDPSRNRLINRVMIRVLKGKTSTSLWCGNWWWMDYILGW